MGEPQRGKTGVPLDSGAVSEVVHEGRNAVQEISAGLAVLKGWAQEHPEVLEVLGELEKSTARLSRLFADAGRASRPMPVATEDQDLARAWEAVRERLAQTGPARVAAHGAVPACLVAGYPALLEELLRAGVECCVHGDDEELYVDIDISEVDIGGEPKVRVALRPFRARDGAPSGGSETRSRPPALARAIAERCIEAQGGHIDWPPSTSSGPGREVVLVLRKGGAAPRGVGEGSNEARE